MAIARPVVHDYQAQLAQSERGYRPLARDLRRTSVPNMPLLLPDLEALLAELDQRLTQIGKMFAGTAQQTRPSQSMVSRR